MEYGIKLSGCDDNTIFNMKLTDEELKLVERISAQSKEASMYSCMPTLEVGEKFEDDEDEGMD